MKYISLLYASILFFTNIQALIVVPDSINVGELNNKKPINISFDLTNDSPKDESIELIPSCHVDIKNYPKILKPNTSKKLNATLEVEFLNNGAITEKILIKSDNNSKSIKIHGYNNNIVEKSPGTHNLSNEEFIKISNRQNVTIIDVRPSSDYKESKISNSINIPFDENDFRMKLAELPRNKTYLIYCQKGIKSERTYRIMKFMKFKKIYCLEKGFENWKK
jgi:rhodanese-related sulfurtransferase